MILRDTPPASPQLDEDEIDEDDLVYIGDVDDVLQNADIMDEDDLDDDNEEEVSVHDDAVCVFTSHKGSVFCGSISKDGSLAVTGGEDDKAFLWEVPSGNVILTCTGHSDSVVFAEFSQDGSYLATADMAGMIQVWKLSTKLMIWDYNTGDMTWMQWHPVANVLFAGTVSGEIYMWKIPSGEVKILQSYGQRVETAAVMPDGKRLAAGYEDGTIRLFDLKSGRITATISADFGHNSTITTLNIHTDNNLLISTAMDGKTIFATSQSGKVISVVQNLREESSVATIPENAESSISEHAADTDWVEAAAFCKDPGFQVAATGTVKGQIFIWDVSKQTLRQTIQQDSGVSKLVWHADTSVLYAAGLDGVIRCFDARSGQHLRSMSGHTADILDMSLSADGRTMLTTSDDFTARIFMTTDQNFADDC